MMYGLYLQKSHKADIAILQFSKNLFVGIIRIKTLYRKFWGLVSFVTLNLFV